MTTPILKLPELADQQASAYIPHNQALRTLEAVAQLTVIARVSALPAGSPDPVDGDRYILTAADGGGAAGDIAYYSGGWRFVTPEVGWVAWVLLDADRYTCEETSPGVLGWTIFTAASALPAGGSTGQVLTKQSGADNDADWENPSGLSSVVNDATTARTLDSTDINKYIRMTSGSANTVTIPPNSSEAIAVDQEVHVRQAGTGSTTLVAGAGVTLNGNLVFSGQFDTKTLKKVATDEWDVIGAQA